MKIEKKLYKEHSREQVFVSIINNSFLFFQIEKSNYISWKFKIGYCGNFGIMIVSAFFKISRFQIRIDWNKKFMKKINKIAWIVNVLITKQY